jgi:iron-sulfur cluster assembly accessory protein
MLTITESAVSAIKGFIESSEKPTGGLRIEVTGGGCSGFQYGLRLEEQAGDQDEIMEMGGIQVFIDPASAPMLSGVTVDFVSSIEGAGFKFENPNATASCGCGNSFSC